MAKNDDIIIKNNKLSIFNINKNDVNNIVDVVEDDCNWWFNDDDIWDGWQTTPLTTSCFSS